MFFLCSESRFVSALGFNQIVITATIHTETTKLYCVYIPPSCLGCTVGSCVVGGMVVVVVGTTKTISKIQKQYQEIQKQYQEIQKINELSV